MRRPCWLAEFSYEPCSGHLERAHLIREQVIRREVCGTWGHKRTNRQRIADADKVWDERVWVWACKHHHGRFDAYQLPVPPDSVPPRLLDVLDEWGIRWALEVDRRYATVGVL